MWLVLAFLSAALLGFYDAFKSGTDVFAPKQKENNVRYIIMNYFREMKAQGKVVESKIEGRCVVE